MAKLDRLGWAAGISFVAYGLRVGVRVDDADSLEQLKTCFPPGWRPSGSPIVDRLYSFIGGSVKPESKVRRFHVLYADATRLARTMDVREVLGTLETYLQLYIAESARRRVFVHAGVVGWNGRAIVIPGRSFSGKSTLVAALVRAGAIYYSDEYAVLDYGGRVHPYSRPLYMRDNGNQRGKRYPVDDLGGKPGVTSVPVGLVLATRYRQGARRRHRSLTPGRALLELLANTVPARRKPQVALSTLKHVVLGAPTFKGVRGEAAETAEFILSRADRLW